MLEQHLYFMEEHTGLTVHDNSYTIYSIRNQQ